jgi:hypothetical protein
MPRFGVGSEIGDRTGANCTYLVSYYVNICGVRGEADRNGAIRILRMVQMGQCQLVCYSDACTAEVRRAFHYLVSPFSHKRSLKILSRQSENFLLYSIQTITDKRRGKELWKGVAEGHTMIGPRCNQNDRYDFSLDNNDTVTISTSWMSLYVLTLGFSLRT